MVVATAEYWVVHSVVSKVALRVVRTDVHWVAPSD